MSRSSTMVMVVSLLSTFGCAHSVEGPEPILLLDDAGMTTVVPNLETIPDADVTCVPQQPEDVCFNFVYNGPDEFPVGVPITQYSVACKDPQIYAYGGCVVWAINPAVYSPGTWALCCEGAPVQTTILE